MFNSFKNDPILKTIGIIVLVTLGIGLVFYLFGGPAGFGMNGYGRMGEGYGMMGGEGYGMMGGEGYGMMGGYAAGQGGFSFGGLLSTLFHILLGLSILGLVVGLAVYVYQLITKRDSNGSPVVSSGTVSSTATCAKCKAKIPGDAKFCPACGTKVEKAE